MSKVLEYKFKSIGYTCKEDDAIIQNTQHNLKKHSDGELPLEMLNTVIKAMMEDKKVVSELCNKVNEWIMTSENNCKEVPLMFPKEVENFISIIKGEEDFIKGYNFDDAGSNLWLIVKEADYETCTKYIKLARETMNTQYEEIIFMIYSEDEDNEVIEELQDYNYRMI
jgi:hypothetical protein